MRLVILIQGQVVAISERGLALQHGLEDGCEPWVSLEDKPTMLEEKRFPYLRTEQFHGILDSIIIRLPRLVQCND
jgi:hypothetical protein